jgi:hypothetical protein
MIRIQNNIILLNFNKLLITFDSQIIMKTGMKEV